MEEKWLKKLHTAGRLKDLRMQGITKRWVINILGVIALFFVIVFVVSAFTIRAYYYNAVESILNSGASTTATNYFSGRLDGGSSLEASAADFIDSFSYRDKTTIWIINNAGGVVTSSSGFAVEKVRMPDYEEALAGDTGRARYVGHITDNGEKCMAVTRIIYSGDGEPMGAVRVISSLEMIDRQISTTLFGNGERTGNVDVVTLALNMWTQGVDPKLDFHNINEIKEVYERCTKMQVPPRQPYAGELVFTAFSGSHQDAINKGKIYMEESGTPYWEIPYLPIDPADVGREYEPIIRINSQSGKGGTAFILANNYGIKMPKSMHPEFSAVVQKACDEKGKELKAEEVFDLFQQEYRNVCGPYRLVNYKISEEKNEQDDLTHVHFSGELKYKDNAPVRIEGNGNGPVAAFCDAMNQTEVASYQFVDYSEHAISVGSDSKAISYIHLKNPQGKDIFGIGVSHNIGYASMKGIICAINRDQTDTMRDDTMPGIFEVC